MDAKLLSLIGSCIAGDGPSWITFFLKFGSIAVQILNKSYPVLSPDENEDIIQNIFVKLTNGGLKNFNGTTVYEFLAYFRKITG